MKNATSTRLIVSFECPQSGKKFSLIVCPECFAKRQIETEQVGAQPFSAGMKLSIAPLSFNSSQCVWCDDADTLQ